jgi:F-type H+-transporting ATPase subunit a
MEEHRLWITELINRALAPAALWVLDALHLTPENRQFPIPNHVAMEIVVLALSVVFFLWFRTRISVERPGATQQCLEMLLSNPMRVGARDMLEDMVGHHFERYLPMIGTIGIFVLFCNLISLVPGFASPTAQVSVPFGCAVTVFLYYNFCGIRKSGVFGYGKHFLGPVLLLAPIMLPIEIVSNCARMLSLTVRLWVNMLVSELLYSIFLGLMLTLFVVGKSFSSFLYILVVVPLLGPLLFIALHIFVAFLQAFVFTLLPIIYVSGAVAEQH